MRPHLREWVRCCARELDCPEPIVEVGAREPPGQEGLADLRPFFAGRRYVGCDMQAGPGVDRIEDLHALKFGDGEVGTFLLVDTYEHVRDPLRAMAEVRRALSPGGVVIYTSVMFFPIHGHPNDYWRFTPEAFRQLARGFAQAAVLYDGDPHCPHTVAAVAVQGDQEAGLRRMIERSAELAVPAPLHLERHAALQIRHLTHHLLGDAAGEAVTHPACGFLPPLEAPAWTLVHGQWCQGWVSVPGAARVVVRSAQGELQQSELRVLPDSVAAACGLDPAAGRRWFRDQVDLRATGDVVGGLDLEVLDAAGAVVASCRSPSGILLGSVPLACGLVLHSLDLDGDLRDPDGAARPGSAGGEEPADLTGADRGRALVAAIRARGEEVVVDLGCGFRKEGNLGIDLAAEGRDVDLVCRLGFEPIPLADGCVDKVVCRDFLEHLPKAVYLERERRLRYPVIDLFNEVWRVLCPGGLFESLTPVYPHPEVHQDPTHLSVWTVDSMKYFCGEYPIAPLYGVEAEFELLDNREEGFYLFARLRKPEGET